MGPGVLGENHHAHCVPVQPGQDVDPAGLARAAVVTQQKIRQGPGLAGEGGVDDEARGLVHSDEAVVLIKNIQGAVLGGEVGGSLVQGDGHHVPGDQEAVRVGDLAVDPEGVQGLEPPDQPVGDPQLPPQSREQLRPPLHDTFEFHSASPVPCCLLPIIPSIWEKIKFDIK